MKSLIEFRNVDKIYSTGEIQVQALKDASFTIESGEFVSIMGPSGSGKSTLMNILGCLDRPTAGEYLLEGRSVGELSQGELAALRNRKFGFVFQSFNLLARMDALQNVELPLIYAGVGAADRRRRAEEALSQVGLADRIRHRPQELSGGQQQRVAIARALVNKPRIIMADEPTGNLDSRSGEEIMEMFKTLNGEGITIIMVTHEPDIAAHTKRTIRFRDGRIIDDTVRVPREVTAG